MSDALNIEAVRVVDDLIANGAALAFKPARDGIGTSFTYELRAGGDRQRCRQIIVDAKWRAALWPAVVQEIAARAGMPHG